MTFGELRVQLANRHRKDGGCSLALHGRTAAWRWQNRDGCGDSCVMVAQRRSGIVGAVRDIGLTMPLVVRLEGTNVEKGKEILAASGFNITAADDLDDAAIKAVAAIQ